MRRYATPLLMSRVMREYLRSYKSRVYCLWNLIVLQKHVYIKLTVSVMAARARIRAIRVVTANACREQIRDASLRTLRTQEV